MITACLILVLAVLILVGVAFAWGTVLCDDPNQRMFGASCTVVAFFLIAVQTTALALTLKP